MTRDVVDLQDVDRTQVALVGGKAAGLGELSRLDGVRVPAGFCVTADAFRSVLAATPSMHERIDRLSRLGPGAPGSIRTLSEELRGELDQVAVPEGLESAITAAIVRLGEKAAYAVRSSATTEDTPTASSAGQQDSFLDVVGPASVVEHVRRCWASLFTERAVTYRLRHGVDPRSVAMAVVVQRMVAARASGVLFTADPVTGDRRVTSIEAGHGLGEALVAGLVSPDVHRVRDGQVVEPALDLSRPHGPVLTRSQVVGLARLGRLVEAHFGSPQDIEWCLDDEGFQVVQSRPITTLFPVPVSGDDEKHVYVSVGHGQMMTDPMRPLGLSFWLMTTPAPMTVAGGRLFVDVTRRLASPEGRSALLDVMGRGDPLVRDALETVLERGDVVAPLPDPVPVPAAPPPDSSPPAPLDTDPAVVEALIASAQESIAVLRRDIATLSGPPLLDFVRADLQELRRILFDPLSHQVFMSAMDATHWLNDHLLEWLGEANAADTLTRSVPHNVTSEMGLGLLDVADAVRPHADVVAFLEQVEDDGFLDGLERLDGGRAASDALRAWLDAYGMRCVGEIDITRPRWSEHPSALLPVILGNVRSFPPGEAARRFERGRREAWAKEQDLLARLRALPDGDERAVETSRRIDLVRTFIGYREYPKYGMVSRYFEYKKALLREAERLVEARVLRAPDDIFYLDFEELQEVVRTHLVDERTVLERRAAFASCHALTPPRVLTSDGEAFHGAYRRGGLPADALVGVAVSAGTVEGRARVVRDMADADLEPGDILVTTATDPSWTPLFVAVAGLVTEVGGLMTHGAVIAREYGLPTVVGVQDATRLIPDRRRIRVHGTEGYVEVLPPA